MSTRLRGDPGFLGVLVAGEHSFDKIANRIGPEPCAGIREDVGEAWQGNVHASNESTALIVPPDNPGGPYFLLSNDRASSAVSID